MLEVREGRWRRKKRQGKRGEGTKGMRKKEKRREKRTQGTKEGRKEEENKGKEDNWKTEVRIGRKEDRGAKESE